MRIDKFLWAVRLFKTRSLAKEACEKERIKLNEEYIKPSKIVAEADEVQTRELGHWRTFKVSGIPKNRIGAKLVVDYLTETTPEEILGALDEIRTMNAQNRQYRQIGRPTKKDRRSIDRLKLK